jgi:F-type H+-transporting ATPase subunit b
MELVNPGLGLIFWMLIAFSVVFLVLKKFAWPSILKALKEREEHIEEALRAADRAHEEMKQLKLDNQQLLREAKEERELMLNEAKKIREKLLDEARSRANAEADRIVESARERIANERMAAITEIKNQIAEISINVAEHILKEKIQSPADHQKYIEQILAEKQ